MFSSLTKEKIFFTQHLYLMLKGGFLVSEALETLRKEVKTKIFKLAIDDVLKSILAGQKLSKSMARHPKIFDSFYRNIVKIGEDSGSLEENLKYLSFQLDSEYEIKKKIGGAMLYPMIVVTLAVVIAFGITIFILPKLLGIFEQLQVDLPVSTVILINTVLFTEKIWPFILLGIIIFIMVLKLSYTIVSISVTTFMTALFSFFYLFKYISIIKIKYPLLIVTTQKIIYFFQHNWYFLVLEIIVIIVFIELFRRVKPLQYFFDKIAISFPVYGLIVKNTILSRLSQSFYTLLKSGVPILEALELIYSSLPNEVFRKNLKQVQFEIERGGKISKGLEAFPETFPVIFSQMISVGEKSGSLEESFSYLAQFYQKEVDSSLKNLTGVLEPVLLIIIGLFVTFISLAIITPIYQFSGQLRLR